MKLAEALAERADLQRRHAQLTARALAGARVQEGDPPAEDMDALLAEAESVLVELEALIARINATNAVTAFDAERTVTEALAARDVEALRMRQWQQIAEAAATRQDRYTRTEVKFVPTVDIAIARRKADASAKRHRELDTRLQELNWTTELR